MSGILGLEPAPSTFWKPVVCGQVVPGDVSLRQTYDVEMVDIDEIQDVPIPGVGGVEWKAAQVQKAYPKVVGGRGV